LGGEQSNKTKLTLREGYRIFSQGFANGPPMAGGFNSAQKLIS